MRMEKKIVFRFSYSKVITFNAFGFTLVKFKNGLRQRIVIQKRLSSTQAKVFPIMVTKRKLGIQVGW